MKGDESRLSAYIPCVPPTHPANMGRRTDQKPNPPKHVLGHILVRRKTNHSIQKSNRRDTPFVFYFFCIFSPRANTYIRPPFHPLPIILCTTSLGISSSIRRRRMGGAKRWLFLRSFCERAREQCTRLTEGGADGHRMGHFMENRDAWCMGADEMMRRCGDGEDCV